MLIGGLSLAILVFLIEKIVYYHKLNRSITSNIAEKPKQEAVKKKIRGNKAVNKNKMALKQNKGPKIVTSTKIALEKPNKNHKIINEVNVKAKKRAKTV